MMACVHNAEAGLTSLTPVLCMHPSKPIDTNEGDQCVRGWIERSMLLLLLLGDDPNLPDLLRSVVASFYSHRVEGLSVTSFNSPVDKGNLSSTQLKLSIDSSLMPARQL